MKLWMIEYGWGPSCPDSCIVVAEDEETARRLADGEHGDDHKITEITEVDMANESVIYTGYNCC